MYPGRQRTSTVPHVMYVVHVFIYLKMLFFGEKNKKFIQIQMHAYPRSFMICFSVLFKIALTKASPEPESAVSHYSSCFVFFPVFSTTQSLRCDLRICF